MSPSYSVHGRIPTDQKVGDSSPSGRTRTEPCLLNPGLVPERGRRLRATPTRRRALWANDLRKPRLLQRLALSGDSSTSCQPSEVRGQRLCPSLERASLCRTQVLPCQNPGSARLALAVPSRAPAAPLACPWPPTQSPPTQSLAGSVGRVPGDVLWLVDESDARQGPIAPPVW
jgi:hypothetical protein